MGPVPECDVSIVDANENPGSHENVAMMSSHAVSCASMNGSASEITNYQSTGITENGSASIVLAGYGVERQLRDGIEFPCKNDMPIIGPLLIFTSPLFCSVLS